MAQLNQSKLETKQTARVESELWANAKPLIGAFTGLLVFAALFTLGSCSKAKDKVAIMQPSQPAVSEPVTSPAPMASTTTPPVQKKTKKRRPANFSYVNKDYGVSFTYPRQYSLKTGEKANLTWAGLGLASTDFVKPGGTMLAAVELPDGLYPGTDFATGFVNVSVNSSLSAEECSQFAFPEPGKSGTDSPARLKLGANEFSEDEHFRGEPAKQADAKYYHLYKNETCYEFALGLGTEGYGTVDGIKQVDHAAVFRKLETVLATVKISDVPATESPVQTEAPAQKETPAQTQTPAPAETPAPFPSKALL